MSFHPGDIVRLRKDDVMDGIMGRVDRVGARQCQVTFMRLPWTRVDVPLSEMKSFPNDQLVKCRDPWSDALEQRWSSPTEFQLRLRAAELWLGNAHGQLGNARTDLLPHQVCLVHDVLEREPRRLMIAEEVGMGKTIETGMIVHALMQRRELDRCLVICPAGQIRQWQEELENKLQVRFEIYRHDIDGQRAFTFPRVIASLDTVKLGEPSIRLQGKSHREILLKAPDWDLVVFDEAHRLTAKDYGSKTEKTLNYRLAEELCQRTRDFLFLTGTPHDGNDSKFRNLLKALDPGVVFSPNEEGRFFGNLILKNRKMAATDAEGQLLFKSVKVEKVSRRPLEDGESQFHAALNEYLREGYGVAESDPGNPRSRAIGFVMTTFQKLATSSVAAVRMSLSKRLKLLEKAEVEQQDPEGTSIEDDRFEGEDEVRKSAELQTRELREAFAEMEVDMLRGLVEFPVPREAKWLELGRLLDEVTALQLQEKFLIFTEYRGTVAFLKKQLEEKYGEETVVTIMGGMGADMRKEAIDRFRSNPGCRFLVSTEAGGEGINLQFCNLVVNYDLPWNPFRVVQRIGRVHRIGQRRSMRVFNLQLSTALDERLTECHEDRVERAVARLSEVTGLDIEDIREQLLGFAQEFINYDRVYREALAQSGTVQSEQEISEGIQRAEEAFRLAYETVFRHAVSPFNPDRFKEIAGGSLGLEDLREWLESHLKSQGRRLMRRENENLWEFLVPEGLKDRLPTAQRAIKGTFDRALAMTNASIDLLAFGHPVIELILRSALGPQAPGSALRLKPEEGTPAGAIAWALLKEESHAGATAFRLVTVRRQPNGKCQLIDQSPPDRKLAEAPECAIKAEELNQIQADMVAFLGSQFPETDFVEDRLYWLALLVESTE